MRKRLLFAPVPILITAGLIAVAFYTESHFGMGLLIAVASSGCVLEIGLAYTSDTISPPSKLSAAGACLWILWAGFCLLHDGDRMVSSLLANYPGIAGASSSTPMAAGFLVFGVPLLLLAVIHLAIGLYHTRSSSTLGLLISYAATVLVGTAFLCGFLILRLFPAEANMGTLWLLFLGVNNKFSDSCAYFVGKSVGSHKMTPVLSPNKTWEGLGGAVLGGLLIGLIFFLFTALGDQVSIVTILLLAFLFTLGGVFGDLTGSLLKRGAGVDDSMEILPEIGGILDMTDCFLVSLPVALICLYLVS